MSNVSPIKFYNVNFGSNLQPEPKAQNTSSPFPAYAQRDTLLSYSPAVSQINARTPVSYMKTSEFSLPGVENKAEVFKLSNGQKVVLVKKEGPLMVQTMFKTGGFNEPDSQRGISHFIEHNLFNGSERLQPREYHQRLAKIGAYTNAFTANNVTSYYAQSALGTENLEELIKLNSEQVQFPTFPLSQMEKEKEIVCSEINMYDDDASNYAHCQMIKDLFQINSTSTDLVAGRIDNIKSLTRDDLINYYNTYYTPDNATTVIVGDIDRDETLALISKYYTKQNPIKPNEKNHEVLTPLELTKRTDILRDKAIGTSISLGFAGPENSNLKDRLTVSLLMSLFDGSKNARLTKALDRHHVSGNFQFEEVGNRDNDRMCLSYNLNVPEEKSEEILSEIYRTISDFAYNPPSQEELEIAKRKLYNSLTDSNETVQGLSSFILDGMRYDNKALSHDFKALIDSVSFNDIMSASAKYLDLNKAAVCMVHPKGASEESIKNNYNKNKVSFKGKPAENKSMFEKVREYTLPNNMQVAINPTGNTEKCIFATKYTFPMLKDISTAELLVLNDLLNSGSMYRDEQTMSAWLEKGDVELQFSLTPSSLTYFSKCPQNEMGNSFNAINEIMRYPRFTQADLMKSVIRTKHLILTEHQSPEAKLMKELFPDLKIGQTNREIIEELDTLSVERLKELYSRMFQNACATSTLTAPTEQNPNLENWFTYNLMNTVAPSKPFDISLDDTFLHSNAAKTVVFEEDNSQTSISQAYKFKSSGNIEDDAKIQLLNTLLGGGMSSRLFEDLREKQKLAYAVGSTYEKVGNTGLISLHIRTTTDNVNDDKSSHENVTKSLDGFNKHVEALKTTPVGEDELRQAKVILKNTILEGIETREDKTVLLSESKNDFYGKERLKLMLDAIDKVSTEDLRTCANYIFSSDPITSIVGSGNTLKALKLN